MVAIHLVVPQRNSANSIKIESALSQVYKGSLRVTYIDDASDDASRSVIDACRRARSIIDACREAPGSASVRWVFNEERQGVIANILSATEDDPVDTVVVLLDGDDALASPFAIERIAKEYIDNPSTWLTYGSFLSWPDRNVIYGGAYHPTCVHGNHFRRWFWRCAPPRSFRAGLLRAVPDSYLRDDDGAYWELGCDQALLLPMLELGRHHLKHIPDVLYLYDPWNWKTPTQEQIDAAAGCVQRIRDRPELPALETEPW